MDYKTLRPHLMILLVPANFTLLALVVMTLLPDLHLRIAVFPVLYWSVVVGLGWTGIAWAVFQVRVCRARKGSSREGQA